jgi:hypothetical protein
MVSQLRDVIVDFIYFVIFVLESVWWGDWGILTDFPVTYVWS